MPATDASSLFGFGLCLASCSPELSRAVARHAGAPDHHLRLTRDEDDPHEQPRHGRELRLPLRRKDFRQLLAVKARRHAYSGALEATGVVPGLKRLARRQRWHSHRGAFLVDAQAVQAALQKGRSSAGTLRHQVSQAAALSLACDWKLRYAYLPSESNPADDPSRGPVRTRRVEGRPGAKRRASALCRVRTRKTGQDRVVRRFLAGFRGDAGVAGSSLPESTAVACENEALAVNISSSS